MSGVILRVTAVEALSHNHLTPSSALTARQGCYGTQRQPLSSANMTLSRGDRRRMTGLAKVSRREVERRICSTKPNPSRPIPGLSEPPDQHGCRAGRPLLASVCIATASLPAARVAEVMPVERPHPLQRLNRAGRPRATSDARTGARCCHRRWNRNESWDFLSLIISLRSGGP